MDGPKVALALACVALLGVATLAAECGTTEDNPDAGVPEASIDPNQAIAPGAPLEALGGAVPLNLD